MRARTQAGLRSFVSQARRKRKLMSRESWFRPANNMVCFIPSSPGGELAAGIQQIVREEGQKIGLSIRVAEQSGTKISADIWVSRHARRKGGALMK